MLVRVLSSARTSAAGTTTGSPSPPWKGLSYYAYDALRRQRRTGSPDADFYDEIVTP
ncbi:MAG: hypothetical protein U0166_15770 [Acidobacteriota bacterium]